MQFPGLPRRPRSRQIGGSRDPKPCTHPMRALTARSAALAAALLLGACERGLQPLPPVFLQTRKRTGLIPLHQAGVADDVGRQNGGEPTLFAHAAPRTEAA